MVTSALPYVNNVPHLGNIIGCVLSADVYARYCRRRGYNVIYMCGTDEYGTATETKAMEEGLTPRQICDKYHAIHKDIYEWFDIDFDKFGRTSTPEQTEIAQSIFMSLYNKKRLNENTMIQPYCTTCNRFLADRLVEGNCPTPGCGYEDARGDQCDKCGKLLNADDLINPRCKVCSNTPEKRSTDHLFLDLPGLNDQLQNYIDSTSKVGGWSSNSIQQTNAWIRDGLKERCITRDLKWGVPVPLEKYKEKVFYVWFDAPIGYISITANYTSEWEKWWKSPDDVELVQFMGKDNVPFHTVIFPSTLLGTEEPWTLMKTISVTEYLNYESGKFSKSRGVGVFGNDVKSTNIPVEVWRYYLLTNRPEVSDTQFTWTDLQAKQNNELLKNLGNFVHRTLSFLAKPAGEGGYGKVIPEVGNPEDHELTAGFAAKVSAAVDDYIKSMEAVKLKAGLKAAMQVSSLGNLYLQESQFWKLYKVDPPACAIVLKTSVGVVHLLATLLEPFMPSFSQKILKQLDLPLSTMSLVEEGGDLERASKPWTLVQSGHTIGNPEPIFAEMKDDEMESYRAKFAGSQADRAAALETATAALSLSSSAPDTATKGKKGGKGAAAPAKKAPAPAKDLPVDVSRLDIRVGLITDVKKHPDADSLYVEQIDVGEPTPRTVVSGLVKFIPIEQMQNRKVCVLCNLKPAAMRGIKSQAMVLAASNADHTQVELVAPPEGAAIGERVTFPGFPGEPDDVLNPKKKIWESVQPDLHTASDRVAQYKDVPFTTSSGICTVETIANGGIK
jgi:methionyl-tRNA synthetase